MLLGEVRHSVSMGREVPIVEWTGIKVHRLVMVDSFGAGITACGRRIPDSVAVLVGCALELERPSPCLNCHRSERT